MTGTFQFFLSLFLSVSQSQVCRIEKRKQKKFGCPSHICASLGQGVSIISVSVVNLASRSYRSHLGHFDAVILATPYINWLKLNSRIFFLVIWSKRVFWHFRLRIKFQNETYGQIKFARTQFSGLLLFSTQIGLIIDAVEMALSTNRKVFLSPKNFRLKCYRSYVTIIHSVWHRFFT